MNPMIIYPQGNGLRPATAASLLVLALAVVFGCGLLTTLLIRDNVELRQREGEHSQALAERNARVAELEARLRQAEASPTQTADIQTPTRVALAALGEGLAGLAAVSALLGGIAWLLYRAARSGRSSTELRLPAPGRLIRQRGGR